MSKQAEDFRRLTTAGEVRAANMDLLLAVTQLVERQRPSVDDLLAAVTFPWATEGTAV